MTRKAKGGRDTRRGRKEDEVVEALTRRLGFEVPYARNRDALDFQDVGIRGLVQALRIALAVGGGMNYEDALRREVNRS